ncbi:arylesterase [Aliikangiella maris]|uniref:Arylesterase n=2 Tax=Aliikangiella maris TaxID=3162458 RepID=A0ABV2BVJ6_9GAMM
MKTITFIRCFFIFVSLFTCQYLFAQNTTNQQSPKSHASLSILVFGDSLSAAYNIQRDQGWVSLLQDFVHQSYPQAVITNASISGETTDGGLVRLPAVLKQVQPDIVILELGGNDGLRGFNLATTRVNLQKMIELARQHQAHVLLTEIQLPPNMGKTYTQRFAQIYSDLSLADDVTLIPGFLTEVGLNPEFMQPDGLHPNAKGQPILMQTVWRYLSPLIKELNTSDLTSHQRK